MTTQKQVRAAFWEANQQFDRQGNKTQNEYPCDIRCAFVDYVEMLVRDGLISEKLADKVTL